MANSRHSASFPRSAPAFYATPSSYAAPPPTNIAYHAQQTAMTAQASFYTSMLDMLRYMSRFTVMNLTHHLAIINPRLPRPVIDRFVGDTVTQFHDKLDLQGSGERAPDEPLTREQTMQKLRDMVTNVRVIEPD